MWEEGSGEDIDTSTARGAVGPMNAYAALVEYAPAKSRIAGRSSRAKLSIFDSGGNPVYSREFDAVDEPHRIGDIR